jgi:hypothetical protein
VAFEGVIRHLGLFDEDQDHELLKIHMASICAARKEPEETFTRVVPTGFLQQCAPHGR